MKKRGISAVSAWQLGQREEFRCLEKRTGVRKCMVNQEKTPGGSIEEKAKKASCCATLMSIHGNRKIEEGTGTT